METVFGAIFVCHVVGWVCPYNHADKLRVGDVQHLVYHENNRGPVAKKGHRLNDTQRAASKNTHRTTRSTPRLWPRWSSNASLHYPGGRLHYRATNLTIFGQELIVVQHI